jgi:hypothetical protein
MPGVQALSFCVEEFVDLQKEGQQFLGVLPIGGQFSEFHPPLAVFQTKT